LLIGVPLIFIGFLLLIPELIIPLIVVGIIAAIFVLLFFRH